MSEDKKLTRGRKQTLTESAGKRHKSLNIFKGYNSYVWAVRSVDGTKGDFVAKITCYRVLA